MNKDYGSWSLADLKSELKKRNAKVTGKKAVLVKRLEDYDTLFGQLVNDPESVFKIAVPNPEHFRDVTSDSAMPVLTETELNTFCELIERADVTTSRNMYEEKFLISCRIAKQDSEYFITGLCASEMRKNISYSITLKLRDYMILEAQCECAAGVGPYGQCKHILVMIYGVIDFNMTKNIKRKESCTNALQTFHHPRGNYTGNPIQAENLTLKFKDKNMKKSITFDPRPIIESQEKFQENFKSMVANSAHENPNMSIAHLILPADKRSLYKDHDYLKKTKEEEFFDSLLFDKNQLIDLEENTRTNKKEWLKQRTLRLQSSDFGKICKQQSNLARLAKCLVRVNTITSPAIKHGRQYEMEAIKIFTLTTGLETEKCGIIVHPVHQFLGSTPDALVGNDQILEVKCPYTAKNEKISVENVPFLYLCEETGNLKLDKKHNYFYQIQGQLLCCQRDIANFFIYTINDYYLIKIQRDEEFINQMFDKLKLFYDVYYKEALLNKYLYAKKTYM